MRRLFIVLAALVALGLQGYEMAGNNTLTARSTNPDRVVSAVTTPERAFWDWFVDNEALVFAFERDQERIFDQLLERLHRVDSRLAFEFGPERQGRREFIISADGLREAFPAVARLFKATPKLARWDVIAFRPRRSGYLDIHMGDTILKAEDVLFTAIHDSGIVDLTIYLPDQFSTNRDAIMPHVYLMLDSALGEYDVEARVGAIDLQPASIAQSVGARPIAELAQVVDALAPPAPVN